MLFRSNPRDGGAWWEAVCGVAQSRAQLKRLMDHWPFLAALGDPPAHSLPFPPLCPATPLPQLSLRLKAMKRQVEEAEEEIDRLESSKKKLQRELEEQMDVNEQLQGQLNSMKKDLRWASV